jgi:hypothetical protein
LHYAGGDERLFRLDGGKMAEPNHDLSPGEGVSARLLLTGGYHPMARGSVIYGRVAHL